MATRPVNGVSGVSRREFLNYVWGSSMALVLAQGAGIAFWFALPRWPQGATEYVMSFSLQDLPAINQSPVHIETNNFRFFITHTEEGIAFLDTLCTHSHCVLLWFEAESRFACPCHGSQFARGGTYIAGPAPRSMDRYGFEICDAQGQILVQSREGAAVPLPVNAATVWVNTTVLFKGERLPWQG